MGDYLAHIRRDDSAEQTVSEHLRRVGDLMAEFAAGIGLSATARLIGLLHDLGKCTQEFAEYLAYCRQNPDDHSRRGTVDHATAGGQLLLRRYGAHSEEGQLAAELAALVIFYYREVIGEEALDRLFAEAVGEFSALDARIQSCESEETENYHFAWGMVHKLLFRCWSMPIAWTAPSSSWMYD